MEEENQNQCEMYTRKQDYEWYATCQSQKIGGFKQRGEGKHYKHKILL